LDVTGTIIRRAKTVDFTVRLRNDIAAAQVMFVIESRTSCLAWHLHHWEEENERTPQHLRATQQAWMNADHALAYPC
jgi:hypothetical protein